MATLIYESDVSKVYERSDGNFAVHLLRPHNVDGIIEKTWDVETFMPDGIHASSGVCTHNFPIRYAPGDKRTLKEKALSWALSYEKKALKGGSYGY